MTSAPCSARSSTPSGPAMPHDRSRTRMPSSAPAIGWSASRTADDRVRRRRVRLHSPAGRDPGGPIRRAAIAVAAAVLAVLSAAPALAGADKSAAAPRQGLDIDVRHALTYRHVGSDDLKLDAYIPAGGGVRPGVMVIYGGGWILGSKELSAPLARVFAERGYIAFAMNYRLAPFHPFPAAVDDVQASVAWVRDHAFDFGLDPARIGAIGGSAGGHLSAMLATLGEGSHDHGSRITAAASWAGPMDLHPDQFGPDGQIYV